MKEHGGGKSSLIDEVMNMSLGEALSIVLDQDECEYKTYEDLLDDLTCSFWKMLPFYLGGSLNE